MKGVGSSYGVKGILQDLGIVWDVELFTDSSAAKGIAMRRGLGEVRHIELCEMWLQEQAAKGKVKIQKLTGEENIGDSLTKPSSSERIMQTLVGVNQGEREGRHVIMPQVAKAEGK